jgi:alkanesulfonate monooxygenase SsuD/methylene tetrahydromethanopterin reductase-like flavin-dependent oxidoreductase (luciferase family)
VVAPEPVRVVPAEIAEAARTARRTRGGDVSRAPSPAKGELTPSSPEGLRFGLHLSAWDVPGGRAALGERLSDVAARAERAGFDSIWVMDHFRQIPQVGRAWEDMPESTATLGYLAAATSAVSIGCLVNGITYRNVAHLGKIVATLDVLSGGRARCGLGAAWFEAEHAAYGWPFPAAGERLDLLEDALRLLPVLWGPGQTPFSGRRITVPETMCYPRPVQERIPILVGGSGKRTLRLVAQHADACNLMGDAASVRSALGVLSAHCTTAGRDLATIEVTHLSTVLVAAGAAELDDEVGRRAPARARARWTARVTPGTVEDHVLRAKALQAAGVQLVSVSLVGVWDSAAVERFGEVIASAR